MPDDAPPPPARKWKVSAKGMPVLVVEAADAAKAREAYIARLKLNRAAPVTVALAE
jgi:hypothetical protein